MSSLALGGSLLVATSAGITQEPDWIWHPGLTNTPGEQTLLFRCAFRTPPYTWNARLTASADDRAEFYLNGRLVATCAQSGTSRSAPK